MIQVEWGKLIVLLGALTFAGVGMVTGRLSEVAASGIVGTIVGYVVGNGRVASRGEAPKPLLGTPPEPLPPPDPPGQP